MVKTIVWGATGFIGRHLVEHLSRNCQIQVIVRAVNRVPDSWKKNGNIAVVHESNVAELGSADIMYFLAWGGTSGSERANIGLQLENVERICEAVQIANKLGCKKFVYTGSIMEYEAIEFLGKDGNVPGINLIYSVSKLAADYYARILANHLGMDYCNALISNIYGPGELSQRFIVTSCRKLLHNENLALTKGTQLYDFIYITDAVEALECIGNAGKNNSTYYVGNREQKPLCEYIKQMKELLGSKSQLQFGAIDFSGASLSYEEFDTSKLYDELKFECKVNFEEGIRRTAKWIGDTEKSGDTFKMDGYEKNK